MQVLNLSENPIHEPGFETLCQVLNHNTSLKALGLESTSCMNERNAFILTEVIKRHNVVDHLDLARNAIRQEWLNGFFELESIKYLNLNSNGLIISKVLSFFSPIAVLCI